MPDEPETPEVEETPTPEPEPQDYGTDWKAEARKWEKRSKDNSDAAARLTEIEDASKSAEQRLQDQLAEATAKATGAESQLVRMQVAADKGLTPAQAKRLTGETRDELEADADELLELLTPPEQDPPPGGRPKVLRNGNLSDSTSGFDPEALAEQIHNRNH